MNDRKTEFAFSKIFSESLVIGVLDDQHRFRHVLVVRSQEAADRGRRRDSLLSTADSYNRL